MNDHDARHLQARLLTLERQRSDLMLDALLKVRKELTAYLERDRRSASDNYLPATELSEAIDVAIAEPLLRRQRVAALEAERQAEHERQLYGEDVSGPKTA